MATLEAVTSELRVLNQNIELNFEANLEINDNISVLNSGINQLTDVMKSFVETVPASVMKGFDALLDFEKNQEKQRKREEEVTQQKASEGEEGDKPTGLKGAFMGGFESDPIGDIKDGIFSSISGIISTVGAVSGVIVRGFSGVLKALKVFRVFMLGTFIPGIMAMFSSVITALTPIVIAAAPFIAVGVAIGAALFGLYKLLEMVTENLGFDSIGETLMYAVLGIKDTLFEGVNVFLNMYNGIVGFVKDLINMTPDWMKGAMPKGMLEFANSDMGEMEMLETDSAVKYKEKKQEEAKEDSEEAKEDSTKRGAEIPSGTEGAQLSERGQAAVDNLKGSGAPEVDPETGRRGRSIGSGAPKLDPETGRRGRSIGSGAPEVIPRDYTKQQEEQFKKDVASGKPSKTQEPEPPKPVKVKKIADDFYKEQELNERVGVLQAEQRGLTAQKDSLIQSMLAEGIRVPADSRDPDYPFADLDKKQAEVRAKLKEARAELDKFEESQGPDPFDAALEGDSGFDAALEGDSGFDAALEGDSGFDAALEGSDDFYDETPMKMKGDSAGNVTTKVTTKVTESGGGSVTRRAAKKVDTEESKALSTEADAMQAALDEKLSGMDDMDAFDYLMTDEGNAEQDAIKQKRIEANAAKLSVAQSDIVEPAQERVAVSEEMRRETTKMKDGKAAESKSSAPVAINAPNTNTNVTNQTINAGPMASATDKSDRTDRRAAFRGKAI